MPEVCPCKRSLEGLEDGARLLQHLWGVTCLSKGVRAAGLLVQSRHQKPALCLIVFRRAGS